MNNINSRTSFNCARTSPIYHAHRSAVHYIARHNQLVRHQPPERQGQICHTHTAPQPNNNWPLYGRLNTKLYDMTPAPPLSPNAGALCTTSPATTSSCVTSPLSLFGPRPRPPQSGSCGSSRTASLTLTAATTPLASGWVELGFEGDGRCCNEIRARCGQGGVSLGLWRLPTARCMLKRAGDV